MDISACDTDDDLEAWRAVRIAVVPGERCVSVAELKEQESPKRLMLLARQDGVVVGSGLADESDTAGGGFAMPRVLSEHRRQGVGSALLHALADHCSGLGLPVLLSGVDDPGSLAFAERRTPELAPPGRRLAPQAPHPPVGSRSRAAGDLHLDPGRQHLDGEPERAPRLRHHPDQHHRLPRAPAPADVEMTDIGVFRFNQVEQNFPDIREVSRNR